MKHIAIILTALLSLAFLAPPAASARTLVLAGDSTLDEHGGDLEIDYVVDFDHAAVGRNTFRINVRELNS